MKTTILRILLPLLVVSFSSCNASSSSINSSSTLESSSGEIVSSSFSSETFSSASSKETSSEVISSSEGSSGCDHRFTESIEKKATIIEKGVKKYTCSSCGYSYTEEFDDLDEFVFEDGSFVYDGEPHILRIKGMLPYGYSVSYQNETRTELGNQEVTANIYNEKQELVLSKKANLSIVENQGFPNIYVDTEDVEITSKETYVPMKLSADNCETGQILSDVPGGIRLRGNGTMTYDKKSFRVKFDKKTNLLDLNDGAKCKSWVLLADYADQSMMRNESAFYIGNSLFNYSSNYCSSYRHVHLYLNDAYNGVYLLAEQQQANANRVPVNEAGEDYEENDIGFLFELDNYAKQEDYYFEIGSSMGDRLGSVTLPRKAYSIKTDVYADSQVSFAKKYLGNVYNAFLGLVKGSGRKVLDKEHNLIDSPYDSAYETLNSFIDMESLFKIYLIHEIMKNVDVGFSSFYLYVDFSETSTHPRLTFGAPWDFDWSSGNCNESPYKSATGDYNSKNFNHSNPWLYLLSKCDFFQERMAKYYDVFLKSGLYEGTFEQADYESIAFADEFARNYTRWKTLGTIIPKYTPDDVKAFKTHRDAVTHLTNWLKTRKNYLDSVYASND